MAPKADHVPADVAAGVDQAMGRILPGGQGL